MPRTILLLPDAPSIVRKCAALISNRIQSAIRDHDRCTMALSGGTSVGSVFEILAADPAIDWSKVFLFWGDDRFVERTNPHSSYKLAQEKLLSKAPNFPTANVFPVPVDPSNPIEGAKRYSETIRTFFRLSPNEWPRLDIAINGMGPDGHTASLFPHSPALDEQTEIAVMSHARLAPWVDRVTLTFPVFNHARCVLYMVTGASKAQTLKTVLESQADFHDFPTRAIQPIDGDLIWLLDPAAAALLSDVA